MCPSHWTDTELRLLDRVHDRTSPSIVAVARATTLLGETPVVWAAVGGSSFAHAVLTRRRDAWLAPVLTLASAATTRRGVAELIARPRPPERLWRGPWSGPSFPSRHTTLGTLGVALTAANLLPRPGPVAVAAGAAIGLSRIVLGVHWPTDVVGGWVFAAAALALRRRACRDRG